MRVKVARYICKVVIRSFAKVLGVQLCLKRSLVPEEACMSHMTNAHL